MGTTVSKPSMLGLTGTLLLGVIGLSFVAYQAAMEQKEDDLHRVELSLKERYLFTHYGQITKEYLELCKEEIRKTTEENLGLSIRFFKSYFSIIDLMTYKEVSKLRKTSFSSRIKAQKQFNFSEQQKLQKEFVEKKIVLINEAQKILIDILGLDPDQVMASKIIIIRSTPRKFISILLKGPASKNKRLLTYAPESFDKKEKALEYLHKKILKRTEHGFTSVDKSKFPSLFEEDILDDLVYRFGVLYDQVYGVFLKDVYTEKNYEDRELDLLCEFWDEDDQTMSPFAKKFIEMLESYVTLYEKLYDQMVLYEKGLRVGKQTQIKFG